MNIDDKLSQVFDVAPIEKQEIVPAKSVSVNKDLESDFETTRRIGRAHV